MDPKHPRADEELARESAEAESAPPVVNRGQPLVDSENHSERVEASPPMPDGTITPIAGEAGASDVAGSTPDGIPAGRATHPQVVSAEPIESSLAAPPGTSGRNTIGNLFHWHDEPVVIERGPLRHGDGGDRPAVELFDATRNEARDVGTSDVTFEPNQRTQTLLSPTSDGGPPLARPIVLVTLAGDQLREIVEESLAAASRRDATTVSQLAEEKVEHAFWVRDCQMRAAMGTWT